MYICIYIYKVISITHTIIQQVTINVSYVPHINIHIYIYEQVSLKHAVPPDPHWPDGQVAMELVLLKHIAL